MDATWVKRREWVRLEAKVDDPMRLTIVEYTYIPERLSPSKADGDRWMVFWNPCYKTTTPLRQSYPAAELSEAQLKRNLEMEYLLTRGE